MINIKEKLNKLEKELVRVETNIDNETINYIRMFIYKSNKWIVNNREYIKDKDDIKKMNDIKDKLKFLDDYIDNVNDLNTANSTRNLLILNTVLMILSFLIAYFSNSNTPIIGDNFLNKHKHGKFILLIIFIVIIIVTLLLFNYNII